MTLSEGPSVAVSFSFHYFLHHPCINKQFFGEDTFNFIDPLCYESIVLIKISKEHPRILAVCPSMYKSEDCLFSN